MMHMDPAYVPDIPKTMRQLRANHLEPAYFETSEQALEWIKRRLRICSRVAIGGSNTLRDIGVTAYIENGDFRYTNRYVKGHRFQLDPALPQDEVRKSYLDAFTADFYLMSSNAVTEGGELVNVDGQGNRVAALAYGPQEVIVVVGRNKIVRDRREAFERLGRIIGSGGMGEQRGFHTPCRKTRSCVFCKSPERRCCTYTITSFQRPQAGSQRIQVLIVNEELGF